METMICRCMIRNIATGDRTTEKLAAATAVTASTIAFSPSMATYPGGIVFTTTSMPVSGMKSSVIMSRSTKAHSNP